METSFEQTEEQTSESSHWALYIAICAFALGAIGTAVSVVSRNQAQSATMRIENLVSEVNKTVDSRMAEIRPGTNDQELVRALEGKIETLESQNRATIEALKAKCETLEKAIHALHGNSAAGGNNASAAGTPAPQTPADSIDPTTPGDTTEYIIKPGDNFYKIAKNLGCTKDDIQKLNPNVDPQKLQVGKKIIVPAK